MSAWVEVNRVAAQAAVLESIARMRMERGNTTYAEALAWAIAMWKEAPVDESKAKVADVNTARQADETALKPTKPGFYWALWVTPAPDTHEGDELCKCPSWEVVQVWENFHGEPCEADQAEKFGVSVPGVREAQWLENFVWGQEVKR